MKKFLASMMILTLVLSLFGCEKSDVTPDDITETNSPNITIKYDSDISDEKTEVTDSVTEEINNTTETTTVSTDKEISDITTSNVQEEQTTWGKKDSFATAAKGYNMQGFYINFPKLIGMNESTGKISYQNDGTVVIVDGQTVTSPEVKDGKLENVLSSYFEQTVTIMKAYKPSTYENFKLNIASQKKVKIGDYDMCRFTGTITFENAGEKGENFFTAYSTKIKGNDTFAYWLVFDDTEDQSMKNTVEEYADNMSKTLVEGT